MHGSRCTDGTHQHPSGPILFTLVKRGFDVQILKICKDHVSRPRCERKWCQHIKQSSQSVSGKHFAQLRSSTNYFHTTKFWISVSSSDYTQCGFLFVFVELLQNRPRLSRQQAFLPRFLHFVSSVFVCPGGPQKGKSWKETSCPLCRALVVQATQAADTCQLFKRPDRLIAVVRKRVPSRFTGSFRINSRINGKHKAAKPEAGIKEP